MTPAEDAATRAAAIALGYRPEATGPHSPLPWKIIRYHVPYGDWIMDSESGMVCGLFRFTDESLLLNAPTLLRACEAVLGHLGDDDPLRAVVAAAVTAAKGEA